MILKYAISIKYNRISNGISIKSIFISKCNSNFNVALQIINKNFVDFVKGMHTTFTLSQAGDLGNFKSNLFQLVKSVECKTVAKKSTISTEKLNKIFYKNRANFRQKLDVICNTSNNFHIKSLHVIKYVKNNLPIFEADWLQHHHRVGKKASGKEDFWQLNGSASKFNSS